MLTTNWNHLGFLISIPGVRNVLQSQEGFLIDDQIYIFLFLRYIGVLYIKLYVLCETNPLVHSKSLMDVILGVRNILHGSRKLYQEHSLSIIRY